jgi:protein TonB
MTLIPLISAVLTAPEATTAASPPAGTATLSPRNAYGSDSSRHPVAAVLAVGLPVALVVAVALSPMVVDRPPTIESEPWETHILPKPVPPAPQPDPKPQTQPPDSHFTAPPSNLPPIAQNPPEAAPQPPYAPPVGAGAGPAVPFDPPAPPARPPLVLADLDPRFAAGFQPDYPAREQRGGIEGVARVRVLIGTDGRVKAVELVSTDSPGFFEETKRRALAKWRFKPATRGGVAEESWKAMTVRFEIKNA